MDFTDKERESLRRMMLAGKWDSLPRIKGKYPSSQ